MRQHRGLRLAGLLCVLAIVVASLVPASMRPHSGAPKGLEHMSAYAVCGSILALGFPQLRQALVIAVLLVMGSAILEVGQAWAIARTPAVSDFGFSSFGAVAGLLVGIGVDRLLRERFHSPAAAPRARELDRRRD